MSQLPKINPNPLDDLFSTESDRQSVSQEKVINIDISEIESFKNHPFHVRDNADMDELIDSIKENGLLEPCIVRPSSNGRYEMISGHRRKHAAIRAGIENIPCIVRNLDDNQATILMVDSNKHRPYLLPSEKAYAYKMRLEATKQQGKRTDLTSRPVGEKLAVTEISADVGESERQIHRFVRLTNLIPELLQMVDNSVEKPDDKFALAIAMRPAVELSYLTPENQRTVLSYMEDALITPSHAQAIILRNMQKEGRFSATNVYDLLSQDKPNQKASEKISISKFSRYFPADATAKQVETEIIKALDFYRNFQKQKNEKIFNKE